MDVDVRYTQRHGVSKITKKSRGLAGESGPVWVWTNAGLGDTWLDGRDGKPMMPAPNGNVEFELVPSNQGWS